MKIEDWAEEDRALWQNSLVRDDPFSEDGARAELRATSNTKVMKGYGRYLTFIKQYDADALDGPAEHAGITPERGQNTLSKTRSLSEPANSQS